MTIRQLVTVALRLFALWLCVAALQVTAIITAIRSMSSFGHSPLAFIVVSGVFLGIALALWLMSVPLAGGLLSGLVKTEDVRFTSHDMVVGGCVLMGLWWLKDSIVPLIVLFLKGYALSSAGQSAFEALGPAGQITAAMHVLQILVSLLFICRPYRIAGFILGASLKTAEPMKIDDAA